MSVTFCNLDDELKIIIMLHENGKNQHVEICKSRYNRVDFSHFHRLEKQSGVPELAEAKLRVETKYVGLLSTREPCMCAIKRSSAFSLLINPIYSRDDPRNGFAVNNSALSD
ncbi:unnamed protein product [Albugo candida]|uniref:Uncharacterized protein n=1 Tax=Albugo candida TaxID=65357 RepID=A0A024FT69_9STRA|nr:unnamed protein product [Albugo candida]|eukprot:CCI10191.1 unnamed protein product [Albugo candida]